MLNRKTPVLKVSVGRNRKGLSENDKKLLLSKDDYILACKPFYNFMFEEIKKIRGENLNEKTKEN